MKKSILTIMLVFAVALTTVIAQQSQMQTSVRSGADPTAKMKNIHKAVVAAELANFAGQTISDNAKPIKGQIVTLNDFVYGRTNKLSKAKAREYVAQGIPLVLKVGNKVYFVYNEDGSPAYEKLAKFAANDYIGVIGAVKRVNGLDIIIARKIESMG